MIHDISGLVWSNHGPIEELVTWNGSVGLQKFWLVSTHKGVFGGHQKPKDAWSYVYIFLSYFMGFVLLLLILILLLLLLFVGVKGCNENNHAKSFLMKLSLKMQFKQT